MADKLIIPMIVLAQRLKTSQQVPAINPNYKTALQSYLGKDSTPSAFNANTLMKKGVHLHFILPSAFKTGVEIIKENGEKVFEYPAVPDRFIVTRMFVINGKIETSCHIVESNFYSLDSTYSDSITIPKFDDQRERHRFRYMGRTYAAQASPPAPVGECGYFDKITAVGAGDPMFSAYYPSCSSVFGFYDNLEQVPSDAVLSYFVMGYYSDPKNDILSSVKNLDDMKKALAKYRFSIDDEERICSMSVLFGEVARIDLSADNPPPTGEINVAIGKSSAEALSAMISGIYYKDTPKMERFLTSIQYDTADEAAQPDGNYKIDDDIHLRGFSRVDGMESAYSLKLPKDMEISEFHGLAKQYSEFLVFDRETGKLRRILEYKKKSLYSLWEMYMDAGSERAGHIAEQMETLMGEISRLRSDISARLSQAKETRKIFEEALNTKHAELTATASEPFYLPKDPVVMLFGSGMNRTYAFGEDGRFEEDNTLFCLTKPLTADIPMDTLLCYFKDLSYSAYLGEDYQSFAASGLLLDTQNLLPGLGLTPQIKQKYSPLLFNGNSEEPITLLMQWESVFYPNYDTANPKDSELRYGDTDYSYKGAMSEHRITFQGVTALTPHGVYNLQDKLKKYLEYHTEASEVKKLTEKIKDIAAVSQNLGGFTTGLAGYEHVFQFPVDIDPKDAYSKKVATCITPDQPAFYEPPAERPAVRRNMQIFPLREGFFDLSKLALVTTFGEQRRIIDDELHFKAKKYVSENLRPIRDGFCSLPLALTSHARLSANFVAASDKCTISSPLPEASPIIGIFMPDMLNRNLNAFTASGVAIGTIRTVYRIIDGTKQAFGRFTKSPLAPVDIDSRITDFISALTQDDTAFSEVMAAIDNKLNKTLPLSQNNFIFGRALVLAEISVELELFGGAEWSKKEDDAGAFNDVGLSKQEFPVYFGDQGRVTDGVCCGFYSEFSNGFCAFGAEDPNGKYLSAGAFSVSAGNPRKSVTLLFDPLLKVTMNTGFLPVRQLEIYGDHTDFSEFSLLSAELNTVISGETQAELPDFARGASFGRFYPKLKNSEIVYTKIDIGKPSTAIEGIGKTMITDGLIIETW